MREEPATTDVHLCLTDSLLSRTEAAFFSASCGSSLTSTWAVEVTSGQVGSDTRTCRWYEPGGTPSLMLSSPEVWFSLKNLTEGTSSGGAGLSAAPCWQRALRPRRMLFTRGRCSSSSSIPSDLTKAAPRSRSQIKPGPDPASAGADPGGRALNRRHQARVSPPSSDFRLTIHRWKPGSPTL